MKLYKKIGVALGVMGLVVVGAVVVFWATSAGKNILLADTATEVIENMSEMKQESEIVEMETVEETRPQFIMIQFEDQIRETVANLHTFEGFSIYIPESWYMASECLTPPAELTLEGAGGEIWIECYEGESLSQAEERFRAEGYVYENEDAKWRKNEGSLVKRVQLEEKEGDVWALFRVHDEALVNPYGIDVVADTCIFTGSVGARPEKTKEERILVSDVYYYEPAKYFYEMDWEHISTKIDSEENETLQKFMPILKGEAFTWIYQGDYNEEQNSYNHNRTEVTIREMLAQQMDVHGLEQVEPLLDSFYFADVFQSGNQDMVLCLRNMGYEWLILHEEKEIMYGIDMSIRWFSEVYENGLYVSSGGADDQSYHRMRFVDGDYIIEDVARVYMGKLIIDGEEKSDAEYEAWKKENLKGTVKRYNPLGDAE